MTDLSRMCDRRTFLKACGVLGVSAAGAALLPAAFDIARIDRRLVKVTQTRLKMGTFVTMTAVHESRQQAEEAIGRAFEEMDRLVGIFSRHDTNTPLSVLNQNGVLNDPPPELVDIMLRSLRYHGVTRGAFDVTVKPLIDLFVETVAKHGQIPTGDDINNAMARVGSDLVDVSRRQIRLARPGMGITLDGVAKGHIVDCASEVLTRHGIENHLVNAGGDIRTRGARPNGDPWKIAVQDPEGRGNYPAVIELGSGAVATSGNYEIYFDQNKIFHHVVDPRTGLSPTHGTSVSVVAPSVMQADALSTAVFVLEPVEGTRLIDGMRGGECMVVARDGTRYQSEGWCALATAGGARDMDS